MIEMMISKGLKTLIGLVTTGLIIVIPAITQAIPGSNVLITDNPNHRVIEINPVTNNVVWSYGGSPTLRFPNEATKLTNGNILIADTYNHRIVEVRPDQTIAWTYGTGTPVDVRKYYDYGIGASTILMVDRAYNRILEVTYPGGVVFWNLWAVSIPGTYTFWEVERRPGIGTPTYLITSRSPGESCVIVVERTGMVSGTIVWKYPYLNDPRDAEWLPCGSVLITDTDNRRVIEVQPILPTGGTIVWQWNAGTFTPYEATLIENNTVLVAGAYDLQDDAMNGIYPPAISTSILEITRPTGQIVWEYSTGTSRFVDVEEKGIINIAKIEYRDVNNKIMPKVFAGVVVPIFQPEIVWVGTPTIVATKTVTPTGPQRPGATLTYTIVLRNIGVGTATDVIVTDQIPEGTRYLIDSDTPEATAFSNDGGVLWNAPESIHITHLRWHLGNLAPNETRTLTFSVVIRP